MKALGASRDVLPIWKTAADASVAAEMHSLKPPVAYDYIGVTSEELLAEFTAEQTIGVAAEVLNLALLDGNEKAMKVSSEYILKYDAAPPDLIKICSAILRGGEDAAPPEVESSVKRLRDKLKKSPNNPLVWTDLARAYAVLNEPEKAEKAMLGALHTSNDHRWICRSAARLYVHFNDYGKALRVLQKNPNLRYDPWLLSTELAVSRMAERPLRNWTQAKKVVDSNISQLHLSELASSIGTSEIIGGADKKAKAYFKQALILPNGNSLAQVKWADRSFGLGFSKQIHSSLAKTPSAYETRHWECYEERDMLSAIKNAQRWWEEEPYSSKPPQAISFIASLVNDLGLIHRTTEKALERNPNDTTLRLND
ncbi:hypothetical protein QEM14_003459 [Pseudomonas putida]|nr:hypothetical protein [Pseudomonas putida]